MRRELRRQALSGLDPKTIASERFASHPSISTGQRLADSISVPPVAAGIVALAASTNYLDRQMPNSALLKRAAYGGDYA
jgi:hypothetical protein